MIERYRKSVKKVLTGEVVAEKRFRLYNGCRLFRGKPPVYNALAEKGEKRVLWSFDSLYS